MADCTHDNWTVVGNEYIGNCTCTDCGVEFNLATAFNRLRERMLETMAQYTPSNVPKAYPKIKGQQAKRKTPDKKRRK